MRATDARSSRCCPRSARTRERRYGDCSPSTRLRRALAAGDDTTDLDSFAALDGLEVAVRVAVASAEAPLALLDAADLVVDSTDEFLALLRRL